MEGREGQAQFTLEKKRPTVVFVDDRAGGCCAERSPAIPAAVPRTLLKEQVLTNVIDTSAAMSVAAQSATDLMDITSLAKAVQAEVVIYISSVDSFSAQPRTGEPTRPKYLFVKVIDITGRGGSGPRSTRGMPWR